jgi:hypothetical protein
MVKELFNAGNISRISELEISRYTDFFLNSYKDNLEHCKAVVKSFPRWSIISGYYAMHDITKLLLAKNMRIKIEREVHATTIKVLENALKNKILSKLLNEGYKEFIYLANDLASAKRERVKTQYYTGSDFMKKQYERRAEEFLRGVVEPYIMRMNKLL